MNYYRFSDLTISMTCRYDIMKRRAEKYLIPKAKENELSETTTPEIRLNPKNELIQKYQEKYPHLTLDEAELILLSSHFSLELIKHQGFVLHASAISYNDKAVLFSADSGVGKSTHTRLWQNHFGKNNVHIINDDKPALRLFGNSFTVYGTPFSGNSDENENIKAPLHAVVFLEQCEHNAMKKLTAKEALPYFLYNIPELSKALNTRKGKNQYIYSTAKGNRRSELPNHTATCGANKHTTPHSTAKNKEEINAAYN